jgi:methylenetetrahydrofolate reductase (NADPH)
VISELMDTCFLVNVVHNDFHDSEAIFEPFFKAGAEYAATQNKSGSAQPQTNGH